MIKGVDTSSNNSNGTGKVDFRAIKTSGRQFAMIRVGYGRWENGEFVGYISQSFAPQIQAALAAGLDTGVYWFTYAVTEEQARIEARACLKAIEPYTLTFPVAFDQEYVPSIQALTTEERTNICIAFLEEIKAAGYYPMLYGSKDWLENWLDGSRLEDYDKWVAQYAPKLTYKGNVGMWQYTGSGIISGVQGPIDLDLAYKDYPSIIGGQEDNPETPQLPDPPEKPEQPEEPDTPGESLLEELIRELEKIFEAIKKEMDQFINNLKKL
ncbi:glycoside hydrolase family 25 protein [Youxingia wuxianensis]|uniref:Lysozyme n=1 Tax=Youxingia wuxianensis TaxID=2763678 RepID=A0A926IGU5_9FIRM|nr:glycoside hydrolase family 25 protein [Youxingia wuxianensis]MBC8584460.1 hypothetical protein [Youxingia wuxianensis]